MAIEAISTAASSGAPRNSPAPSTAAPARAAEQAAGPKLSEAAISAPQRGAETKGDESRSRLTFDDELSRTFVDVVDEDSGEVISRFPPEKIVRHIQKMIEDGKLPGAGQPGFLVDQVV